MEKSRYLSFNQQLRDRTFAFALEIHSLIKSRKIALTDRSMVNQLLRCSSSVAANLRSATRARSAGEYYSKICIVTEECDETQFWLNFLVKAGTIDQSESSQILKESEELVKIFTTIKKKMKERLNGKSE